MGNTVGYADIIKPLWKNLMQIRHQNAKSTGTIIFHLVLFFLTRAKRWIRFQCLYNRSEKMHIHPRLLWTFIKPISQQIPPRKRWKHPLIEFQHQNGSMKYPLAVSYNDLNETMWCRHNSRIMAGRLACLISKYKIISALKVKPDLPFIAWYTLTDGYQIGTSSSLTIIGALFVQPCLYISHEYNVSKIN